MKHRSLFAVVIALASLLAFALNAALSSAAGPATTTVSGTASPAATNANDPLVGAVAPTTKIEFEIGLRPSSGAAAFATAVTTPGNPAYRQFLTPAQWEQRFSPSVGAVSQVLAFLRSGGFSVTQVTPDRMTVTASGTAAQVERVFKTSVADYDVAGTTLRLENTDLSLPTGLAGMVSGVSGISQTYARPALVSGPGGVPSPFPPPAGFRVAPPCSTYYGQQVDTTLPAYGNGYPSPAPWAVCGYTPPQFRSAYGIPSNLDGTGVTVAITDAYASPTLLSDAQQSAALTDPSHPLLSSQFSELLPTSYDDGDLCGGGGWYGEQTLDVEAVHAMAPGAHILYVGAQNCAGELNGAVQTIVDGHLASVITNSWGDDGGDVIDPESARNAFDDVLIMAAGTGVSVLFSSGDSGDEFTLFGVPVTDYPAISPWATAVGGTTLAIGSAGQRLAEYGWSTARSFFCNEAFLAIEGCTDASLGTWGPIGLALDGGSGGGTSYVYPEPSYQDGVVPASLTEANGPDPMRVIPDISMEADPATGFLEGETQTFPTGVAFGQYRIGGTSVSSPLLAGVVADADQAAGNALGFLNPLLYALHGNASALYDVLPAGKLDMSRSDYINSLNPEAGFQYTTRIVDYEGMEQFCTDNGTCVSRDVALKTAPGYDNMTGLGSPGDSFIQDLIAP